LVGTRDGENQRKDNGDTHNGDVEINVDLEFSIEKKHNHCFN
jgi:hypothetical protein